MRLRLLQQTHESEHSPVCSGFLELDDSHLGLHIVDGTVSSDWVSSRRGCFYGPPFPFELSEPFDQAAAASLQEQGLLYRGFLCAYKNCQPRPRRTEACRQRIRL